MWVIQGGPRCGPCFRLARWIEDHHATLEKDYVVVKLMDGIDEHVTEALAGLPIKDGDGIPWFAITEPDGTVLAISRGPLGNIGFPVVRGGNPSFSGDARSNRSEVDLRRSGSTRQVPLSGQVRRISRKKQSPGRRAESQQRASLPARLPRHRPVRNRPARAGGTGALMPLIERHRISLSSKSSIRSYSSKSIFIDRSAP